MISVQKSVKVLKCRLFFLTSRTDSMDELTGMLKGGDDYITKPFQAPILLARIAAVLKRSARAKDYEEQTTIVCGDLTLTLPEALYTGKLPTIGKMHRRSLRKMN